MNENSESFLFSRLSVSHVRIDVRSRSQWPCRCSAGLGLVEWSGWIDHDHRLFLLFDLLRPRYATFTCEQSCIGQSKVNLPTDTASICSSLCSFQYASAATSAESVEWRSSGSVWFFHGSASGRRSQSNGLSPSCINARLVRSARLSIVLRSSSDASSLRL